MVLYSQKLQVKIRTPKDLPNVSKIWKTHPSHCVSKTRILRLNNLLSNNSTCPALIFIKFERMSSAEGPKLQIR